MTDLTVADHLRALQKAKAAGDDAAVAFIRSQVIQAQQAQDAKDYNPTSGMSGLDKVRANLGAGLENFGLGVTQLVLPKAAERALGITDESIQERRARDQTLAEGTTGGKALQVAGEALPSLAIPGGLAAKGLGMIPKAAPVLSALGVGSKVLPTVMAEGATLGGVQGAATPTTSDESAVANAIGGAAGGAIIPAGLAGLGKAAKTLARPLLPSLQREALASKLGQVMDTSAPAQKQLQAALKSSDQRIVDAPQSLATLTQNPKVAQLELAARANPDSAPSWAQFDETAGNARWKALHDALGSDATVDAAKAETNAYARDAIPEVMKRMDAKKLAGGLDDFKSAVQGRLNNAVKQADPASQEVYGYVGKALDQGGGSPRMLWNIRKTLSDWIDGTPPPGMEGTRGAKMDRPIMETRAAIDEVLNRASGNKEWSKFLTRYGEFAQKETAQKAGQNIRNAFFDETMITPRGATTAAGNPAVTRARLEQALLKHGKNDFGETLDYPQRNVIDQTLTDLRGDEILQRAKSSMTGKGGSQTAPLEALMKSRVTKMSGGWLSDIAGLFSNVSQRKQQGLLNHILQSPHDALAIMNQAERLKRPLTSSEQRLVQATRAALSSPSMLVMMNGSADQPGQTPGE